MSYLIANILITGINLIVLGMTIKLYTEYFKDKAQDKRRDINKQGVGRERRYRKRN